MSVVPDLLLKPTTAEAKPKAAPQAPPAAPAASQARGREPSSFSKVYERERQAKSNEPAPSRAQAEPVRKPAQTKADTASETSPAETGAVAADGNVLPVEPQESVDPLLLLGLGMGEEQPSDSDLDAPPETEESPIALVTPTTSLFSAPAVVDAARVDPEMEKLASAAAVQVAVAMDAAGKRQAPSAAGLKPELQAPVEEAGDASPEPGLDALLSANLDSAKASEKIEVLVRSGVPEVVQDTPADSRGEAFAGRLSALAQQINPQLQVARAVPLVPGQPVAMQQGGWSEAVVDRVMWLSSQNLKSAEIQLDPAELGRLEVRINMNQELAQVTFASANPNVRDALESQMYRLRELFAQQGMNQLDVNVSDQSLARGWQGQGEERQARSGAGSAESAAEEAGLGTVESGVSQIRADRGLVDYYA